jgi:hypothetical protein
MASSEVHAWEFVYDFSAVGGSYWLHLQLVSTVFHDVAVYFRAMCISV